MERHVGDLLALTGSDAAVESLLSVGGLVCGVLGDWFVVAVCVLNNMCSHM